MTTTQKTITISVLTFVTLSLAPMASASSIFDTRLSYGTRNNALVRQMQQFLKDSKVYTGPVTGNYLTLTRAGVKNFQIKNNISPANGDWTIATANAAENIGKVLGVSTTDMCLNIAGVQTVIPAGLARDGSWNCFVPQILNHAPSGAPASTLTVPWKSK